ncbi:PEP-CTERM protein-sorting domain-containing protein [Novosphingobium sp. CF614]|uniref:PEP-CTERM sorting domain-containing protein n=1 Tax=Novosphingobium sp. CF614 TaxID=1884364 RepID=UPI0008E28864|nr:PEP-CTERM sorting domain-containing protein [Novosphingobium sp. CF614]SFG13308.1 PEP-CTERM protein-sorting domain-containing protein [Novosphingobium sp. CF614]
MIRKTLLALSFAAGSTLALSTPALAWGGHTHYCDCGHSAGSASCGTTTTSGGTTTTSGGTTTTSGGTTTTSGGTTTTSGGTTTTSGGTTTTSGGTDVPEPGMLGMMGLGLLGLGYARRRKTRA